MATIETIITSDDIRTFAPGVEATIDEASIRPYLHSAHKTVASFVGVDVFNEIAKSELTELRDYLKTAVSNRLMYDYKIFESISRRQNQNQNTYKYELEAMQLTYLALCFDALDSVFAALNEPNSCIEEWGQSEVCKTRSSLLIKTTDEFNSFYGIDGSDFFFFSTIFLQRSAIDKHLCGLPIAKLEESLLRRAKSIAATFTVAYALRQFDITMLPKSMRNSASDGASRSASSEQEAMYKLSEYLFGCAEKDLQQLVFEVNIPEDIPSVESTNNTNKADSKHFLMI